MAAANNVIATYDYYFQDFYTRKSCTMTERIPNGNNRRIQFVREDGGRIKALFFSFAPIDLFKTPENQQMCQFAELPMEKILVKEENAVNKQRRRDLPISTEEADAVLQSLDQRQVSVHCKKKNLRDDVWPENGDPEIIVQIAIDRLGTAS